MPVYTYTTLDDPSANSGGDGPTASGIHDLGQIRRYYFHPPSSPTRHGFRHRGGSYTTLDDPLATTGINGGTYAFGVNGSGEIIGRYGNNAGVHGFLYNKGTYTSLDHPLGTNGTEALGINDN